MRRVILITVLAVIAFAAILIARLPASWVAPTPPSRIACGATDGTLWSGSCAGLTVQGHPVGDVTWQLHPLRLLVGKVAAHVELSRTGTGTAQTDVESDFSGKDLTVRNLKADFRMDPALMTQVRLDLHGSAHVDMQIARVQNGSIAALQGRIEARDLSQTGGSPGGLGSYSLTFPGNSTGPPQGQLRDLGGPLSVEGEVTVMPQPGGIADIVVQGLVAARPTAPPSLANELKMLGTPDAQGRRPFSLENSF
ncbi:MAG TPA: type II secretion system protein N [Steroidobacteraceae bacterium]|nr:type II secretion system protein N [Steroidobacteraceae bacterium]